MGFLWKLLTHRLAGPISAIFVLLLVILLVVECMTTADLRAELAREGDWRASAAMWKQAQADTASIATAYARSFGQAEGLRRREHATAVEAINETAKACDLRVATARKSALAIQAIVTKEPNRDPSHCPVRELVDPRSLRDAVRPAVR